MSYAVLDRSVVVPAVCSAGSKYRALLAFLNYGRLVSLIKFGQEERTQAEEMGGTLGGPSFDELIEQAETQKVKLEEQLGHVTEEWGLVTSRLVLETYADAVRRHAEPKFGLTLDPREVNALVRKVLLTSAVVVADDRLLPLGRYEGIERREDQITVHTAVVGKADYIVTENKSIKGREFTDPETRSSSRAIGWDEVVELTAVGGFDLHSVRPGSW
jgi:hypothetical protein